MLYIAYGSNMNKSQMAFRCPKAKPLGGALLHGWRLVFRGVADIIEDKSSMCPIGLWELTDECEKALDRYEGVPHLYSKVWLTKGDKSYLTYIMNSNNYHLPSKPYFDGIRQGYEDFFGNKNMTDKLMFLEDALRFTENQKGEYGIGGHFPKRFKDKPLKYSS